MAGTARVGGNHRPPCIDLELKNKILVSYGIGKKNRKGKIESQERSKKGGCREGSKVRWVEEMTVKTGGNCSGGKNIERSIKEKKCRKESRDMGGDKEETAAIQC